MSESLDDARAKLKAHFPEDTAKQTGKWELLWEKGDFLPWDKGTFNPALEDLLADRKDLIGSSIQKDGGKSQQRKKALVPGCGRGYDVLLLASFGYDAVGLEGSESASKRCFDEKEKNGKKYPVRDNAVGAGKADFVTGDFFETAWTAPAGAEKFDFIYDYTFLSALPPSVRPKWALRMSQLLADDGHLICLEFPSAKDPKLGGPPYALPPPVYEVHLSHPGEDVSYKDDGHITEDPDLPKNPRGLKLIAHWQPERTHEIGRGQDWISVWIY